MSSELCPIHFLTPHPKDLNFYSNIILVNDNILKNKLNESAIHLTEIESKIKGSFFDILYRDRDFCKEIFFSLQNENWKNVFGNYITIKIEEKN